MHMNQEVLVDAIDRHLDSIDFYVKAIVLLAIPTTWAGLHHKQPQALGIEIDLRNAFWFFAIIFILGNAAIFVLLRRLHGLTLLMSPEYAVEGATKLTTHPWVLNPFCFTGSRYSLLLSSVSLSILIVIWWLCNASLYIFQDRKILLSWIPIAAFLACGFVSLREIVHINRVVFETLNKSATLNQQAASDLQAAFKASQLALGLAGLLGAAAGWIISTLISNALKDAPVAH